jgi:hypothetical protein
LGDTITNRSPSSRLSNVDLPALGAPKIFTKPALYPSANISAKIGFMHVFIRTKIYGIQVFLKLSFFPVSKSGIAGASGVAAKAHSPINLNLIQT